MKVIFLDIDGVLNCRSTTECCGLWVGIDDDKLQRLRRIVEATQAVIVLTSTWKIDWYKDEKDKQDQLARYLDEKMNTIGLQIIDKTEDRWFDRGAGVLRWMAERSVEAFVILDDEPFEYAELGLMERLIQTVESADDGGLQEEHVQRAIEFLNQRKGANV